MKFEIKHRFGGSVLFSLETESIKSCVEAGVKSGANLRGVYLGGAYLGGAYLRGAYLGGVGKLIGDRPIIQISPIGSRGDFLTAYLTDNGIFLKTGCFFGTVEKFKSAIKETHGENKHGENKHAEEYLAAIALIETHARIYTPKAD